jgi:hypothetical protein
MRRPFPLFQSHLDFAHTLWAKLLAPTDHAIDATCGNGHDALVLFKLIPQGRLYLIDIQKEALVTTSNRLPEGALVSFHNICHSAIEKIAPQASIKLIVYNLGYLPGKDKSLTTMTETTLQSIQKSLSLLAPGGAISITCYPGHEEGKRESTAIIEYTKTLSPKQWSVSLHSWINRSKHPFLILIQQNT